MDLQEYDLVVRGGTLATATDVFSADLGIRDGKIAAIGQGLGRGNREIDARDQLVLPGGIDAHAHIEQKSATGIMNADSWESATTSAAAGGTTTVIAFVAQHVGMDIEAAVQDYSRLAAKGSVIDYSFHLIVADPTPATLQTLPSVLAKGHGSVKAFMTYENLKLQDEQLLDVMAVTRQAGAMLCVHAENHGMIAWMTKRLLAEGNTAPKYHAASHPRAAEIEAIERLIGLSTLADQPVMIFHVSTAEGVEAIGRARRAGRKVFAETCTHYLLLTEDDLDRPDAQGAKWMCSPPLRSAADQDALWQGLACGDLQLVSSDHAPYAFDQTGKLIAGDAPTFKQIPNGIPGLQWRMPLLFDAMVSQGRLGLNKFVELTSTAPARIYNLPNKGSLSVGSDADICVWDPQARVRISDVSVLDRSGYCPYPDRTVTGWPTHVLCRGEPIVEAGQLNVRPGYGRFLPRAGNAWRLTDSYGTKGSASDC